MRIQGVGTDCVKGDDDVDDPGDDDHCLDEHRLLLLLSIELLICSAQCVILSMWSLHVSLLHTGSPSK